MNAYRFAAMPMCLIATVLTANAVPEGARAAEYTLDWYTVDCGGTMSATGGSYTLSGTIGQPDAGVMSGGSYELSGGFWFSAAAPPPIACGCGDLDDSNNVDLVDFSLFSGAFGLPPQSSPPNCE